jgi:OOP family OmpA-OmpF porin
MKKSAILATAVGLAALVSTPAHAADPNRPWSDEVGQWFVAPFVGYTWTDSDRLLDDDIHYGASFGKHLTDKWSLQLTAYTGDFNGQVSGNSESRSGSNVGDATLSGGSIDLMRVFGRANRVSPYLLGGIGMQNTNYEGSKGDENVTASVGAGLMWDLFRSGDGSRTVQLRPEIRARYDLQQENNQLDTLAQIGIAFGWGPPIPEPVVEAPPPPPPPPPAKCADTDNDGVCDEADKCPGTAAGVKVDSVGCPMEQTLKLLFDFDSAELRPESITELERVVKFMGDVPFAKALVEGHTDSKGSDAYNQALSDRRAKAVFDYLSSRGVDPARLSSVGKGESAPIADNATDEGRQENRRVMLIRTDSGM